MDKEITIIGLPPALVEYPIAGATAVLSCLVEKGFKASIRYLNISMEKCFYHKKNDTDRVSGIIKVAPFIYLINRDLCHDWEKAETVKKTVVERGFVEKYDFDDWVNSVAVYVNEQMRLVAEKKSLLVAFTSKFSQWIPAIYCSYILKQINPSIPIYIGGQNTSEESYSLLQIGKYFDFSGWGEGEIPVYLLCRHLMGEGDVSLIPRTAFREDGNIVVSKSVSTVQSYLSFDEAHYFRFDDYISQRGSDLLNSAFPIEKSRSCNWNRCRFCFLTQGYRFREKKAKVVLEEIQHYMNLYGIYRFKFFDNDLIGRDLNEFEKLLDGLILIKQKNPRLEILLAEIMPKQMNRRIIKKMSQAGFTYVQIGFEALSPHILKEFRKCQTICENFFFLREAMDNHIFPSGNNIIINYPGEVKEDIVESIRNLSYLRFLLAEETFLLQMPHLLISNYSYYMGKEKRRNNCDAYKVNKYYDLLSESLMHKINRFSLFSFSSDRVPNEELWRNLYVTSEIIKKNKYSYRFLERNGIVQYQEYRKNHLEVSLKLNDVQKGVLTILNERCYSVLELIDCFNGLKLNKEKGYTLDRNTLFEHINSLLVYKIIYYSELDDQLVSMVFIPISDK